MGEDEIAGDGSERSMIVRLCTEDNRASLYEGGLKGWEYSVDLGRHDVKPVLDPHF